MIKIFVILTLISLSGCKAIPDFPNPFDFYSHQDLIDQEREIDSSF